MQTQRWDGPRQPVIGVLGGSGGVGASTFAAVLARRLPGSFLLDLDVDGGGLDVLLGLELAPGARWSGLRLAGGSLDATVLREGLLSWAGCAVLAADVATLSADAVAQVIDVASGEGAVVLDLPRRACAERAEAVARCDLVTAVVRADVAGLVAAHAVVAGLGRAGDATRAVPVGIVARPGELGVPDAARLVGGDPVGALPVRRRPVDPAHASRALARLADGVLRGVFDRPPIEAAVA